MLVHVQYQRRNRNRTLSALARFIVTRNWRHRLDLLDAWILDRWQAGWHTRLSSDNGPPSHWSYMPSSICGEGRYEGYPYLHFLERVPYPSLLL